MTIKNIVISGGGPSGIISYGAIKKLHQLGVWNHSDLTAIYATSIGGFIAFLISMNFEWDVIDDYIIERPWLKAFETLKSDILEIIYNKGVDGEKMLSICTKPILTAKDLPFDITLKQLYDKTHIELCLATVELNNINGLTTELISYKTYPDMTLNCALASTSAIPMILKPVFYGNKCFVDGGLTNNFPLSICIAETKCKESEILAFANNSTDIVTQIKDSASIIEFARFIMNKLHCEIETTKNQPVIRNIIYLNAQDVLAISEWFGVLEHKEKRKMLLNRGELAASAFFTSSFRQETVEDSPDRV